MKRIGILVALIIILIAGFFFWQKQSSKPETKEEAIRQARAYRPTGICTQSLVPAIHKTTGARYTFNSGCLAPGWEPER
jgi:uncharacterized protein YxeA